MTNRLRLILVLAVMLYGQASAGESTANDVNDVDVDNGGDNEPTCTPEIQVNVGLINVGEPAVVLGQYNKDTVGTPQDCYIHCCNLDGCNIASFQFHEGDAVCYNLRCSGEGCKTGHLTGATLIKVKRKMEAEGPAEVTAIEPPSATINTSLSSSTDNNSTSVSNTSTTDTSTLSSSSAGGSTLTGISGDSPPLYNASSTDYVSMSTSSLNANSSEINDDMLGKIQDAMDILVEGGGDDYSVDDRGVGEEYSPSLSTSTTSEPAYKDDWTLGEIPDWNNDWSDGMDDWLSNWYPSGAGDDEEDDDEGNGPYVNDWEDADWSDEDDDDDDDGWLDPDSDWSEWGEDLGAWDESADDASDGKNPWDDGYEEEETEWDSDTWPGDENEDEYDDEDWEDNPFPWDDDEDDEYDEEDDDYDAEDGDVDDDEGSEYITPNPDVLPENPPRNPWSTIGGRPHLSDSHSKIKPHRPDSGHQHLKGTADAHESGASSEIYRVRSLLSTKNIIAISVSAGALALFIVVLLTTRYLRRSRAAAEYRKMAEAGHTDSEPLYVYQDED